MRNFEQYAEKFVLWLEQVEHSVGSRSVELIHPKAFRNEDNRAIIDKDFFSTLDYSTNQLKIDDVGARLAKGEGSSWWPWSKKKNTGTEEGFGLFLRRLYDSCKAY